MARYLWNEKIHKLELIGNGYRDPNARLNGPVWFPKGGTKYFDKALNRWFYSKDEKKGFMRKNGLMQKAEDREGDMNCPEAGLGKRYYSFAGQKTCNRGYKYR